jgi:hypothetical protein
MNVSTLNSIISWLSVFTLSWLLILKKVDSSLMVWLLFFLFFIIGLFTYAIEESRKIK